MKKFQKFMVVLLLFAILVYAVKKHTDTVSDLFQSVVQMIKSPFATAQQISESKKHPGFPEGSMEIMASFQEKIPDEKDFFISEDLYKESWFSQRIIEFSFPKLFNKNARCGYVSANDQPDIRLFKVMENKGGYQIVCRL